jgi:glycosyltransferase involved in cell wall biosynthesis
MGTTCIVGVDNDRVLKDFIRAHVDYLQGQKVLVDNWYPELRHDGKTIRYFHSTAPYKRKLTKLLPYAVYHRLIGRKELSRAAVHDSLAGFFRAHDVDVVLAEFGPTGADLAPHTSELGIPLIVHFHGHDAHRTDVVEQYRDRYREMFAIAFRIVTVSRFMTETLISLGADPRKIVLNPYGPRNTFFSVKPDYRKTVLAVGRFTDIKANYLTLAAFSKVAKDIPDSELVMVGDGELLETCKTLAANWGIADRVTFTGSIPHSEIQSLFSRACCFAQHSVTPTYGDAEGTPVAILEASAAGLPVVSTRHAGITEAVVDGETGFLVEERDVDGMAEAMHRLLSNSELCRQMGAAARKHIRDNFTIEQHIGRLQAILDEARGGTAV